jgi:hypothetical protein
MASVPEEGKGVLFSNNKKSSDKAPDFNGQIMHNGELIKISAWQRQSAVGPLISLAVNTWTPNGQPTRAQQKFPRPVDDGDVPF